MPFFIISQSRLQLWPWTDSIQVHSYVVRGRCHLNVSAIIKKLPNEATIRLVALRGEASAEKTAVKKAYFPSFLDDVVCMICTEDIFISYVI